MTTQEEIFDCAVVGAGMSGLMAANILQRAGAGVVVLEKSASIGGRMASHLPVKGRKRSPGRRAVFDHGAQYFTVRDERFGESVRKWQEEGVVIEWSTGFATSDGSYYADGQQRFRGVPSMGAVPRHLARDLEVRTGDRVEKVVWMSGSWVIRRQGGQSLFSRSVILTAPVPQSIALIDAGNVQLPNRQYDLLAGMDYEPCLAVMLQVKEGGSIPKPGGIWFVGEPIAWMADNFTKGISPVPGAITIHAGPNFSREHWEAEDNFIVRELVDAAPDWLGFSVVSAMVSRWRFSKPFHIYPEPCLHLSEPGPLVFAGDAFAGPRVEGAALSGMAAAGAIMSELTSG